MNKNKPNMKSFDFVLFSVIIILVAFGVIMVFSASSYTCALDPNINDSMYYLKRQSLWALISLCAMIYMVRFDYHKIKKYTGLLMVLSFGLLLLTFAFPEVNGAKRWIRLGPLGNFQPSELVKYVVVFFMAKGIENKGDRIKKFFSGVVPYLMIAGIYAGIVLIQKNLSIAAVIIIITLILLYIGGIKQFHFWGILVPFFGAAGAAAAIFVPYRMKRLMNFINPWATAKTEGYQLCQSLLAIGTGGIWGVGLGQSRQKRFFLPERHTDFIFSVTAEELGLIGCTVIILLFLVFIWRGIVTAIRAKDVYGTILASGITSVIAVQAIINIAVVSGSFPVTGVPLPFISYGGSSLLINLMAAGILLNISRQINKSF
ncbi:MAG: putative lipid II flippase FtsW [Clostridiaceae bacterium]